jgi:molybdopterin/thiamine biosynthesis adenylyltransferase
MAQTISPPGTSRTPARRQTLVSAAILRFDGQLATYRPNGPCYRCIYREAPPEGAVPTCSSAGVLGAMAGTMGALQATGGQGIAGHRRDHYCGC